jgi:hypothetical protein
MESLGANILNKQPRTLGGPLEWGLRGLTTPHSVTLTGQDMSQSLEIGLILWQDLSNGKGT